jgi:endo-1,4-beta-mannosidase
VIPTGQPAAPAPTFVTRTGNKLSTTFVGFNAFGATGGEGTPWTNAQMDAYFAALPANGLTRTWVFPGTSLPDVDRLVASAAAHHQHLVLTLDNDFADCTTTGQKSASFYSVGYQGAYLDWVQTVATRYRTATAVALYEAINEAGQSRGDGVLDGTTMKSFYETTAAAIKATDPNHLVGTGDSAEFVYAGGRTAYQLAASGAHVDVLSLHDYESDWIDDAPILSSHWTPCKQAADALNKPILIGEINDGLSHFTDQRARASSVTTSMRQYLTAGAAGALVWNYTYTDGSYDGDYSIVPTDPMVAAVAGMTALRK